MIRVSSDRVYICLTSYHASWGSYSAPDHMKSISSRCLGRFRNGEASNFRQKRQGTASRVYHGVPSLHQTLRQQIAVTRQGKMHAPAEMWPRPATMLHLLHDQYDFSGLVPSPVFNEWRKPSYTPYRNLLLQDKNTELDS